MMTSHITEGMLEFSPSDDGDGQEAAGVVEVRERGVLIGRALVGLHISTQGIPALQILAALEDDPALFGCAKELTFVGPLAADILDLCVRARELLSTTDSRVGTAFTFIVPQQEN